MMSQKMGLSRRNFLRNSAFGIFGAAIPAKMHQAKSEEKEKEPTLKIKSYRTLGRTGWRVSDIGCGYIADEGLINAMLDAGVNYIDTAESYPNQKIYGSVIKNRNRKSIFISSKMEIKEDVSKEGFLKRTRKCLEELQTDYIDCMMMHLPEKIEILKTEGFHAAVQQLKSEGRLRFVGVSHHGSFWFRDPEETMDKILLAAVDDGRFDVFLMAYNFLKMDNSEKVLQVCKEKNIGTTLMKTKPVSTYYSLKTRIETMQKEGEEIHELYFAGLERYKQKVELADRFVEKYDLKNPEEIKDAAVRFVLSNPNVSTVCCSVRNFDDLERFIHLSGTRLSDLEKKKLAAFREGCGPLYCRHACGVCEPKCPHGVPINTIMRYNHYFEVQSREKYAMAQYAAIPGAKADLCSTCTGFCETACPYDVPIQGKLIFAHHQLSLA
jgi:predicted aldo/keto reductase-like oxidoreductase